MGRNGVMEVDAIPVSIVKSPEELTNLGVEFGATQNWTIPLSGSIVGQANSVQILQRRPTRYKAVIYVPSLIVTPAVSAALINVVVGASTVATPNLNSVPVDVTVSGGTVTQITINGINTGQTSGTFLLRPGDLIATTNTGAPTYTTTLPAGVTLPIQTPAVSASGLMLANSPAQLANPTALNGFLISVAPYTFQWENQQPCYAIAVGAGPLIVSTIDQAQAAAQASAEESVQAREFEHERWQEESGNDRVRTSANQY